MTRARASSLKLQTLQPAIKSLAPRTGQPPLAQITPRMRGRKLQERRKRWFCMHPLCVKCEELGRVREATELDHVIPLHKGGPDDESNLQSLCGPCHKAKTLDDLKTPGG